MHTIGKTHTKCLLYAQSKVIPPAYLSEISLARIISLTLSVHLFAVFLCHQPYYHIFSSPTFHICIVFHAWPVNHITIFNFVLCKHSRFYYFKLPIWFGYSIISPLPFCYQSSTFIFFSTGKKISITKDGRCKMLKLFIVLGSSSGTSSSVCQDDAISETQVKQVIVSWNFKIQMVTED